MEPVRNPADHYVGRFASEHALTMNTTATGGNAALLNHGT
jgi:delta 1-pyrroline-5-carboxylate dehydrogenase